MKKKTVTKPVDLNPEQEAVAQFRQGFGAAYAGPGSGKSLLISVAYTAYVLGCRPEYTIVGISAGEALMQGFMSAVMGWIEFSPAWKTMFPKVGPDKDLGWKLAAGLLASLPLIAAFAVVQRIGFFGILDKIFGHCCLWYSNT